MVAPDAEQLGRPPDRLVHVGRGVERARAAREAAVARAGQRPLARRGQRRHVRDGAAARERAGRDGIAERLAEPLERLALHEVGRARDDREVDVVAGRQRVAEHRDLEPGRRHEREVARPGLSDRVVEHHGRLVERLQHGRRPERDRRRQRRRAAARPRAAARAAHDRSCPRLARSAPSRARALLRAARRAAARVPFPPCRPWCQYWARDPRADRRPARGAGARARVLPARGRAAHRRRGTASTTCRWTPCARWPSSACSA